jgi:hypothetical protein
MRGAIRILPLPDDLCTYLLLKYSPWLLVHQSRDEHQGDIKPRNILVVELANMAQRALSISGMYSSAAVT